MHGVNQAWMGGVNYARGNISKAEMQQELAGGVHSVMSDATIGMATAGAGKAFMVY